MEFGATALTILLLLVKHTDTGWTLDICFPSLLTNTRSVKISFVTIVVQIHTVSMGDLAMLHMFIVMTNQNTVFLQILCLDWFMTFVVPVGMHAWFSFVSNNISCYLSILIPVIKI